MNKERFIAAQQAYNARDFASAAALFGEVADAGEPCGEAYHLRGNALMKLGKYREATESYAQSLLDGSYAKRGAVFANKGKAHTALGELDQAIESLNGALNDPQYETRYKAFAALGNVYMKKNDLREAGVAFRNAALDTSNPDPSKSLLSLGVCFMELGRPADAVEAYRTALDFSMPSMQRNIIFANLGQAYVAISRMDEALSSFGQATADGTYELTPAAEMDRQTAEETMRRRRSYVTGSVVSTDEMLGISRSMGGTDALQHSGAIMPSPEDTGFFDVTESDLVKISKTQKKAERKHKHTGLKIALSFLVILLLALGGVGFAFYKGVGYPTQQSVVNQLFEQWSKHKDVTDLWVSSASPEVIAEQMRQVGNSSTVEVKGMDRDMNNSLVRVEATLSEGGKTPYLIKMVRDGIGWKVSGVEMIFDSLDESSVKNSAQNSSDSTSLSDKQDLNKHTSVVSATDAPNPGASATQ